MSSLLVRALKLLRALRHTPTPPGDIRRILVVHQLLLGDTLLLAPLLKELERLFPDAERVLTIRPMVLPLFKERPYGVVPIPFDRRDSKSQQAVMASGPYDLALVPDDNRYAWLARAAGARWIVGFAEDAPRWKNWALDRAVPYPQQPAAWADLLAPSFLGSTAEPFVSGEWPAPVIENEIEPSSGYAVLHVGASSKLKAWPASRWNSVAVRLKSRGLELVYSGGHSETRWLSGIDATPEELRHFGKLDLAQLWHLFARASLLVCPDTGIAHMARLVGVKTVALFGPGSEFLHGAGEFWQHAPYQSVTVDNFPCRDQQRLYRRDVSWVKRCGRHLGEGSLRCPEPLCMTALSEDAVIAQIDL